MDVELTVVVDRISVLITLAVATRLEVQGLLGDPFNRHTKLIVVVEVESAVLNLCSHSESFVQREVVIDAENIFALVKELVSVDSRLSDENLPPWTAAVFEDLQRCNALGYRWQVSDGLSDF